MNFREKQTVINHCYALSFESPRNFAEVKTSGSYAKKVRAIAPLGKRSESEVAVLCELVEHLRRVFMIMDDLIDEDTVRNQEPAFWVVHGQAETVEQAAWHLRSTRKLAVDLRVGELFEQRLRQVVDATLLEIQLEDPGSKRDNPRALYEQIVEKEAAFRRFIAEALYCDNAVCEAAWQDGYAAQILDDALSKIHGKDGRTDSSDERLGRLTYMKAFGVTAEAAVEIGRRLKAAVTSASACS